MARIVCLANSTKHNGRCIAGIDIGTNILNIILKILHPSMNAASIISLGIVEKKLDIK